MGEDSGAPVKTIYCSKWSTVKPGSEGSTPKRCVRLTSRVATESALQEAPPFGARVKVRQDTEHRMTLAVLDQAGGGKALPASSVVYDRVPCRGRMATIGQ